MAISLQADARGPSTKSVVHELRQEGKVPGVVYGKRVGNSPIAVSEKELLSLLRQHPHAIVELDIQGVGKHPVMVSEVQRHKVTRELLHVDFHQINMDEPIKTMVAIDLVGEPKGVTEGGILQVQLHEVEVRGLPKHIPESFAVDVSGLGIHESVLVSDLQVPEGIEMRANPDDVIASVLVPQKEAEPDAGDATALETKAAAGKELAEDKEAQAEKQ